MCNFWGIDSVPEKYRGRNLYQWNPNVTLMRTNAEENKQIGEWIARAANAATGPVSNSCCRSKACRCWTVRRVIASVIPRPTRPASMPSSRTWKAGGHRRELDDNINDAAFAEACAQELLGLMKTQQR